MDLIEQANIRIGILERQRNDALNQTLNALVELNCVDTELRSTREQLHVVAVQNAELLSQLNTQAEELSRLRSAQPRKRKANG